MKDLKISLIAAATLSAVCLTSTDASARCGRWGPTGYHYYRHCAGPGFLYPHHRHCYHSGLCVYH
ncbi:hypothetical protein [Rhodoblastus sp.]|uniref:hypothetical protein n=1 Tax=Rhodoblastus sp. TaxID=1962975 RepID=UPI003F9C76EB